MRYIFKITLRSIAYDMDEREIVTVHGTRKHVGSEETAIAYACRTRTAATDALIERVQVEDGMRFQDHEIKSFTVGLAR